VATLLAFDAAGRVTAETNALGSFNRAYDGASSRLLSETFPNGQTVTHAYGTALQDFSLQRITHTLGVTPISEFLYGRDLARDRITSWSQQAGNQAPDVYTLGYDQENQLLSAVVTNSGIAVNTVAYAYDLDGNRLSEQTGSATNTAVYNALNQISTATGTSALRTNEWDALNRLTAVNSAGQRTEFTYDGLSRLANIRWLTNGVEASLRRFIWCENRIWEERDASGNVTKRFARQGVKFESGPHLGSFYYTQDHLGSIREVTDTGGAVRARYAYDPYGARTRLSGDVDADFGYAGMFWSSEAGLSLTWFRAYDPGLARWLSRDPLPNAEKQEGPNLYAYVGNDPVNQNDPAGLSGDLGYPSLPGCAGLLLVWAKQWWQQYESCEALSAKAAAACNKAIAKNPRNSSAFLNKCTKELAADQSKCDRGIPPVLEAWIAVRKCMEGQCSALDPIPGLACMGDLDRLWQEIGGEKPYGNFILTLGIPNGCQLSGH
jgi:RHS repeat-associated protein